MSWLGFYKPYKPTGGLVMLGHQNCRCYVEPNPHYVKYALKKLGLTCEDVAEATEEYKRLVEKNNMTMHADILCPKCHGSWMTEFLTTALELLEWARSKNPSTPIMCIHCKKQFTRWEVVNHIEDEIDNE